MGSDRHPLPQLRRATLQKPFQGGASFPRATVSKFYLFCHENASLRVIDGLFSLKVKLALFAALQASTLALAVSSGGASPETTIVAEAMAFALPATWTAAEVASAQKDVEYVVCPFIDFLNHSSTSKVSKGVVML